MTNISKKRLIAALSAVLMLGMVGTILFAPNASADGASVPVAVNDNYGPDGFVGARLHGNVMDNDIQSEFWISQEVQNIVRTVRPQDGETEYTVPATAYDPAGGSTVRTTEGGYVWINQDGSFEYQPRSGFKGTDTFQYQLMDGYDDGSPGSMQTSGWATVTFNVLLAVTWSLTANGTDGNVTTTHLFLQFDADPNTLTAENITVTGATGNVLSEDGATRQLPIADITVGNGGTVTVNITSPAGFIITPASLTVTVWMAPTAPVIFVQPSNSTITAGGNTSFTVAASASPAPAYQWQVSANGTTWNNISDGGVYSGAATATLVLTGAPIAYNNNQYRCVVSNGISPDAVSDTAHLDVKPEAGGSGDGGFPIMIVVAVIVIVAIAGFAAYWFLLRKT